MNVKPILSHDLARQLLARRNNDVVAEHLYRTAVVGMGYCPGGDQIVLDLDPVDIDDLEAERQGLAGAMYSIWLHGDWYWLTRQMTRGQKDHAANAVDRHHARIAEEGDHLDDRHLRWWLDEYRYNQHGADRDRMVISADVDVETEPGQIRRLTVTDTLGAWAWRGRPWPNMPQSFDFQFENVVKVVRGPADDVVRRLDAAEGRS